MALLLKSEKLLLLQIPGTASSALEKAVLELPGGTTIGAKHATLPELRQAAVLDGLDDPTLEVVCVVRNHFDLLHAEWYRSRTRWIMEIDHPDSVGGWPERKRLHIKMCTTLDFSDYLLWAFEAHRETAEQLRLFAGHAEHSTRVFRMEDIAALEAWLSQRTGRAVALPRFNVTEKSRPYWMDYTRPARALVSRLFKDELELYDYSF